MEEKEKKESIKKCDKEKSSEAKERVEELEESYKIGIKYYKEVDE